MNGIIIIDKPSGWTSHDVVGKLRGLLHEKRIGHGGTLDPMATGVLPVFVGRGTRAVQFCENADKEYIAAMRTGIATNTQDTTGDITAAFDVPVSAADIAAALPRFTGEIMQIPPMYSAVKVNGQKLYALARKGVEVERRPRPVTIHDLEHLGEDNGDHILRIVCSKGTYVRTLIHDIGSSLGCGGAMSALRRTRAGAFTLNDAHTLDEVIAAAQQGRAAELVRPVDSLFAGYPSAAAEPWQEAKIRNGSKYNCPLADGTYRVYGENGSFLMLGSVESGVMRTIKSFFEV